jgi:hypothetical protein
MKLLLLILLSGCGITTEENTEIIKDGKVIEKTCSKTCYGYSNNISDYCRKQLEDCAIID